MAKGKLNITDKEIDSLINDVYDGKINIKKLPEGLYKDIAIVLSEGVYKGYGGTPKDFEGIDKSLLADLRENIYMFSAAKTFQQVKEMSEALTDGEGILPFSDYKVKAREIFERYNGTPEDGGGEMNTGWLRAEYDTAIGTAQNAWKWNQIEKTKETFPTLTYNAVGDSGTCEICESLNGTTLPVDDEFWDDFMPPNHFNCECLVEQNDAYEEVEITEDADVDDATEFAEDHMQPEFLMNAGKDRVIFSDEHPYFDIESKYKPLAEENFALPIPEED